MPCSDRTQPKTIALGSKTLLGLPVACGITAGHETTRTREKGKFILHEFAGERARVSTSRAGAWPPGPAWVQSPHGRQQAPQRDINQAASRDDLARGLARGTPARRTHTRGVADGDGHRLAYRPAGPVPADKPSALQCTGRSGWPAMQ